MEAYAATLILSLPLILTLNQYNWYLNSNHNYYYNHIVDFLKNQQAIIWT